jgi:hypothetical protein
MGQFQESHAGDLGLNAVKSARSSATGLSISVHWLSSAVVAGQQYVRKQTWD